MQKNVRKSLVKHLKLTYSHDWIKYLNGDQTDVTSELLTDVKAGSDCLEYAMNASWWEWSQGSCLFFWCWPVAFKTYARDGIPILCNYKSRPISRALQRAISDENVKALMREKISSVQSKKYIQTGLVRSLIKYFPVPKGDHGIRMVYNGTASTFNSIIWVPSFGLPNVQTLLRATTPTSWMVDLDIGDMFLNFCLHSDARE